MKSNLYKLYQNYKLTNDDYWLRLYRLYNKSKKERVITKQLGRPKKIYNEVK